MADPKGIHSAGDEALPPNEPTVEILKRARDGDESAWTSIHERYREALIRIVHGRIPRDLRGRFDTEDVVQSTLIAAAQDLDNYECRGKGSLQAWLFALVRHRLIQRIRSGRSKKRDARRDVDTSHLVKLEDWKQMKPGEALLAAEEHFLLLDAIEQLPDEDRLLIEEVLNGTPISGDRRAAGMLGGDRSKPACECGSEVGQENPQKSRSILT